MPIWVGRDGGVAIVRGGRSVWVAAGAEPATTAVNGSFEWRWETIGCHGKQDADILRGVDEPRFGDLYDAFVAVAITVRSARTEELDGVARASVIEVCVAAHHNEDFQALFSYVPCGGRHFLGYRGDELVSHAMVTTRWLQPDGLPLLKTAYVDAVATHPAHEGLGYGSAVMGQLASDIDADFVIGCLETARVTFYERLGWELCAARWPGVEATDSFRHPSRRA